MPDRFWRLFEDSLGSGNVRTFRDALAQPAVVSIRRNPAKLPEDRFLSLFNASDGTDIVPWCHEGRYLNERPSFTLDPLLHCGAYYVQDSSSMFTGALFSLLLNQCKDQNGLRILDLCAAPGGKTTHLASILRSSGRPDTLLVSNEAVSSRVASLAENVARWGEPNVVVTNSDPSEFIKLKNFFDIILVDAPCSGEGMFRKDEDSVKEWSEEVVKACATRQKHILIDAWPALKSGGFIIYSTCTYNRNENDSILEWIAAQLGADIIKPDYVPMGVHVTRAGGCQFIPGNIRGEGQYVCMLRKKGGMNSDASAKVLHDKKADDTSCDYVVGDYKLIRKGDLLKAVPARMADEIATVEQNMAPISPFRLFIRLFACLGTVRGRYGNRFRLLVEIWIAYNLVESPSNLRVNKHEPAEENDDDYASRTGLAKHRNEPLDGNLSIRSAGSAPEKVGKVRESADV